MLPRTSQTLLFNFPDLVFLPIFNTFVCPQCQIHYQLLPICICTLRQPTRYKETSNDKFTREDTDEPARRDTTGSSIPPCHKNVISVLEHLHFLYHTQRHTVLLEGRSQRHGDTRRTRGRTTAAAPQRFRVSRTTSLCPITGSDASCRAQTNRQRRDRADDVNHPYGGGWS